MRERRFNWRGDKIIATEYYDATFQYLSALEIKKILITIHFNYFL